MANQQPKQAQVNVQTLELAISKIDDSISNLTRQQSELGYQISQLRTIKQSLISQLPTDNRIDHLFD